MILFRKGDDKRMIDHVKIGSFLKSLRKENGKTQEEIAEIFGVSSKSVSRWENGNSIPDLWVLVELADYYNVDIKELIDGERKSSDMDEKTKESLLRVADYADSGKKQAVGRKKKIIFICCGAILGLLTLVIMSVGLVGYLFYMQYNTKGVSSALCITIDKDYPKEYIGELDGYSIYVEKLVTDELYYTTVSADNISFRDAVEQGVVSVEDWRKKAWAVVTDEDAEILLYENYEIAITGRDCIIRPIT